MLKRFMLGLVLALGLVIPSQAQWQDLFTTRTSEASLEVPNVPNEEAQIDFLLLFGPRPQRREYDTALQFRIANSIWEQKSKYFGGIIPYPENTTQRLVDMANEVYMRYNVPFPIYYKDRYGSMALFRGPVVLDTFGRSAAVYPGHVVTNYQIKMIRAGFCVEPIHFFLPFSLREKNEELCR